MLRKFAFYACIVLATGFLVLSGKLFFEGEFFSSFLALLLSIYLGRVFWKNRENSPSPDTHIKCPDCKELVIKEANVCKHCGCRLIPQ